MVISSETQLQQQYLSKKQKTLLSQFKPSLKSPKRFQQFVDRVVAWLSSQPVTSQKKDIHRIERFLKTAYSLYFEASEEAQPYVMQLLQSWFILLVHNPSLFLDFTSKMANNAEIHTSIPSDHDRVSSHVAQLRREGFSEAKKMSDLITLKEAAVLYPDEVSYGDVLRWHYAGRLEEKGRRWLARPGGRSIPLVSQAQLAYLKDHRPPVGKQISKHRKVRSRANQ